MYKIETQKLLYFLNPLQPLFSAELALSNSTLPKILIVPVKEFSEGFLRFSLKDIIRSIANSYKKPEIKKNFLILQEKIEDQVVELPESECKEIVSEDTLN